METENNALPARQIHLDFHTSEWFESVGEQFDAEVFAETLEKAFVNSVTLFARCHHGYLYYDSKAFPERVHPKLVSNHRNLLGEQMAACRRRGIKTPVYLTVQIDVFTAREHPEWLIQDETGRILENKPFEAGFGYILAVNSPYMDFLKAQVSDLLECLPEIDSLFFDIVIPMEDCSKWTRNQMIEQGLDPSDAHQRRAFGERVVDEFTRQMTEYVRSIKPDCGTFYNAGHVTCRHRAVLDCYSHLELESQGSGPWGFMHFTGAVRYARTLGKEVLGMTGKFHSHWGDFHSFKPQASLEFECFRMLALGAKCSIGDQLHTSGKLCAHSYDLIGKVYRSVAEKEPWCFPAQPVAEIGVLHPEDMLYADESPKAGVFMAFDFAPEIAGIVRMLQEGAHQFNLIDRDADFENYKLLILPDSVPVTPELAAKIDVYVAGGGKLIASFESGLDPEKKEFLLKSVGVRKAGEGPVFLDGDKQPARGRWFPNNNYTDYVVPSGELGRGLPETEHVMYLRGLDVEAAPGSEVLLKAVDSCFDRDWRHYVSHLQAPSCGEANRPAAVRSGSAIYFTHSLARIYALMSPLWCRTLLLNAVELLMGTPVVSHNGPDSLVVTINDQPHENRRVVHLLFYIPERRGEKLDIVSEVFPLHDLTLTLQEQRPVQSVELVPQGESLAFIQDGGVLTIPVEKMQGHQMISINF